MTPSRLVGWCTLCENHSRKQPKAHAGHRSSKNGIAVVMAIAWSKPFVVMDLDGGDSVVYLYHDVMETRTFARARHGVR